MLFGVGPVGLKVQLSCWLYVVDVELMSLEVLLLREGLAALGANVVLYVPVHCLDMLLEGVSLLEGRAALLARVVPQVGVHALLVPLRVQKEPITMGMHLFLDQTLLQRVGFHHKFSWLVGYTTAAVQPI